MEPKLVERADRPPGKCIASRDIEGPFIDTGNQITERGRVYLSARWMKEVARDHLDMVPRDEVEGALTTMREQLDAYAAKVADLEELADSRDRFIKAARKVAA